jgi:acyl-CoA thioester hydrolase
MANSKFTWEFTVLEIHLDTFGHMNHATYLQLFEQARWQFITERGYGLKTILETQKGPTILEANVKYKRELRLREKIKIETETIEYSGKVGKIRQQMLNIKGEVCAIAELTIGFFDMTARRLISAPAEWLRAVGVEPDHNSNM